MTELTLYDSQGVPLEAGASATGNDRISDFFFDGVRFTLDMQKGEAVVFLRARESSTGRSEQFYAQYKFRDLDKLNQLPDEVRAEVEGTHGMELDFSEEDTKVFEFLDSGTKPSLTGIDFELQDDLEQLISEGTELRLATQSYRDAYAVLIDWLGSTDADSFAIADRPTSSNLESYDVVVSPNGDEQLELLGDTEAALERLRKRRRRRRRQRMSSGPGGGRRSRTMADRVPGGRPVLIAGALVGIALILVGGLVGGSCVTGEPLGPTKALSEPVCGPFGVEFESLDANVSEDGDSWNVSVSGELSKDMTNKRLFVVVTPGNESNPAGGSNSSGSSSPSFRIAENTTLNGTAFTLPVEVPKNLTASGGNSSAPENVTVTAILVRNGKKNVTMSRNFTLKPSSGTVSTGTPAGTATAAPAGTTTAAPAGTTTAAPAGTTTA
ncbi:MAG: hypothetical protein ABEJ40_00545, partial [Haloarculaceae archaeon]